MKTKISKWWKDYRKELKNLSIISFASIDNDPKIINEIMNETYIFKYKY